MDVQLATDTLRRYLPYSETEALVEVQGDLVAANYAVYTDHSNYVLGIPKDEVCLPVLVMAHVDTVRTVQEEDILCIDDHGYMIQGKDAPLGGDDRCGVAMALTMASSMAVKPIILFTNGEERGGTGARAFLQTELLSQIKEDIYLIVSLDRKGVGEAVTYGSYQKNTRELLDSTGFKKVLGSSWSDCELISAASGIAHANLSCGYNNAHTNKEYIVLDQYKQAYQAASHLVSAVDELHLYEARPIRKEIYGPRPLYKQGHAYYPPLPNRATTMFAPLPKPWEFAGKGTAVIERNPKCSICEKTTRFTKVLPRLGPDTWVCTTCLNKMMRHGGVTLESYARVCTDLEAERNRTRLANKVLSMKNMNRKNYPACPTCLSNKSVEVDENSGGFVCRDCLNDKRIEDYDGHFWIQGEVRVFLRGASVLRVSRRGGKLLNVHDVAQESFVKTCDTCGARTIRASVTTDSFGIKHTTCRLCDKHPPKSPVQVPWKS